ncbi:ornithine aminotransferase [Plasmodium yoelii 17X]|uniref:Ornithine aminotransferase n=5 Tax=Plasmodium yoelii TaxID=5861 RepID=OAT_PLAYO|nr:ornithine aminotransferase, putative [Plasmodium yoelii]Q7RT90.1 RecName: Full=Ornithine aminotransferase; AltName: Full=Ornithine--oxo-acid aminotransferase [Plasmodium yoelii yoelii]ETB63364.1 ornithine aminotransferase [Plasmodium yoelii 17X]EAA20544.1 ornithine aminotransferase [Plasmodium yoelii yoelii]WBY54516.1 ornithine aminotransferase [Plasmodium yoelii yoelii]CDU15919.1 ornithine aminotransferase, putative [Plasmodium yoelii]VTZ71514.1 ornithine aminotransferase, putative [Plasm|eukprot:XP_728979.1 ornithine aminotransferase, putative [Plasmodium yoelii]
MEFVKDLKTPEDYINNELKYGAHNYDPIPVVLKRAKGVFVYDVNDKRYYDFLSAYSSVNQGHCHPNILNAMINQAKNLTICSRAFFSVPLGICERYLTNLLGYDKVLMMNTGAEANETAYKLCRKWGYEVKKIPENMAKIVVCKNNFSGRTLGCISASTTKKCTSNFGPFAPQFSKVPYDDLEALEEELKDPNVCAFIVEPIQGEAGVIVPSDNYLQGVYDICKKYNVLFVADEVQTGLGRTGKLLCVHHYNVKPDVILLGKALSGGHYPISAVLANDDIMLVIKPGEHGSTYGGNPLAASICVEALNVLINEKLCENAEKLGGPFLENLKRELKDSKIVRDVRGKGLLCAIEFKNELVNVLDICLKLKENGLITRDVHDKTIRLTPPLCITKEQLDECTEIIVKTVKFFDERF